ncbi:MAG: Hint domain-containing protein [Pseudomonadota bacterium]
MASNAPLPAAFSGACPVQAMAAEVTGLVAGTDIITAEGIRPVETLGAGDRIVTRDGGMRTLASIDERVVTVPAIRISAGALGQGLPEAAMTLPAGQCVHLRDWRVQKLHGATAISLPAAQLVDGRFIEAMGPRELRLFTLRFARAHIVYAGGLELMSEAVTGRAH